MNPMEMALFGGLVVLLLALLVIWQLRRSRATRLRGTEDDPDRIDTLIGWPPQATKVLSHSERAAFTLLVRALPEFMILAQVPLARFLSVPKRHSYADWLRRLGYQCVDFAVCDANAQVVAVVELVPPAIRATERSRKRHERMARSLKAAHIPLQTWPEQSLPTPEMARELIVRRPDASAPGRMPGIAARPAAASHGPISAFNPFDDAARDSALDERIEILEPPPSTWFDDMDTEPAPLPRRPRS